MGGRILYDGNKAQGAVRIGAYGSLADGNTVTIGDKVFEWDNNGSVVAGHILVTIGGSGAVCATNLKNAINANPPTPYGVEAAIDPVDTSVVNLVADARGTNGNLALASTMANASNSISGAVMTGGENGSLQKIARGEYTVTSQDVAAGRVVIQSGRATPRFPQVECRDSGGKLLELTGDLTVSGEKLLYTFDGGSGGVNPSAGDKIEWLVFE